VEAEEVEGDRSWEGGREGGREGGKEGKREESKIKGGREGGREGHVPRGGEGDSLPGFGGMVDNRKGDAALDDGRNDQAWREGGREGGREGCMSLQPANPCHCSPGIPLPPSLPPSPT